MRLFGSPKKKDWQDASREIATEFLNLRKEFFERCIEALDWNVTRGIIQAPRSREAPPGYAGLGIVAFQMWTARAASYECGYLNIDNEDPFFRDLGSRIEEIDNEVLRQLIIQEMFRLNELRDDPELQNIRLAGSIAAHFYPSADSDRDRGLAINLFAKVVPSFCLRLHAAVARVFGDMKTVKRLQNSIGRMREAGEGY
jgi:hypothetical protein